MEWEALGLNVSRHPLSAHRETLKGLGVTSSEKVAGLPYGTRQDLGAYSVPAVLPTRSGRPVWFLLIEDERGLLQATMFERVYEQYG